jgi:hypothetical protein
LKLGPSEAQSESIKHTFEHALPAELHPPSVKTARSRHAPEVHSLSVEQVALAGLSLALVALAQATAAMTPNRITQRVFTEGLDSRECAAQKSRDSGRPFSGENPRSRIARVHTRDGVCSEQAGATFEGGLEDHSSEIVRYHTLTHLLQAALRVVLGDVDDLRQAGKVVRSENGAGRQAREIGRK